MAKSRLPKPGRDQAGWARALKRASALRTTEQSSAYSDLCYAVKGNEGEACFQALIDSIRVRHDHGLYEATYNAVWRFVPQDYATFMARALPEFIRRMDKYDQVERLLIGVTGRRKVSALFASRVKALPSAKREAVLRAFKRWARHEEEWEAFLQEYFAVVPRPVGKLAIPAAWPARYKVAVERELKGELELKKNWERWPRKDMALFVAELVALDDLGPLWKKIGVILTPLSTYAMKQRDVFIDALAKLPPARRARALTNLRRVNTGPSGSMFRGLVWPHVEARLAKQTSRSNG